MYINAVMLSKFLRVAGRCEACLFSAKSQMKPQRFPAPSKPLVIPTKVISQLLQPHVPVPAKPLVTQTRVMSHLIPPSQYDMPWSKKLQMLYVMRVYWETIPLFLTTFFALGVLFCAIAWAINNKVDAVFHTHSRGNISRTMDLRNPEYHKIMIINQRYAPWPEMQDVLDKMKEAEKRALTRAQSCSTP